MKYQIVEIEELSGSGATIYSVFINDEQDTLFDQFVEDHSAHYREEVKSIVGNLEVIGHNLGAREIFFKLEEGKPGDGVSALYDDPDHLLRLYCIRYAKCAIILGGGGLKPPGIRAWQEDEQLSDQAGLMIAISHDITQRLQSGDLRWSADGMRLEGNL